MSRLTRAFGLLTVLLALVLAPAAPVGAGLASGDTADSEPAPTWGWETIFYDGFEGPAGAWPDQWHNMPWVNGAAQNGLGKLEVGHLSQIRTNTGWTLPAGTEVRVTASILMPDTGSNYAAFWVQHPNGVDPREVDVIESYGPLKPAGAQVATHICYDDTPETAINACAATGRPPETIPVTDTFPVGAQPWQAYWEYAADFTVGGDTVLFSASDSSGNRPYEMTSTPDARRVPGNAAPFHLRLSNKDVLPEYAVPGGAQHSMLVDWVSVEVKYP
ncbi:hypothetical protein [Nocardioides sp.]|uniref:hypothetical protein n=1 Tax=Nocardioides sp. TaxID=35761 RepID=UPI0035AEC784